MALPIQFEEDRRQRMLRNQAEFDKILAPAHRAWPPIKIKGSFIEYRKVLLPISPFIAAAD